MDKPYSTRRIEIRSSQEGYGDRTHTCPHWTDGYQHGLKSQTLSFSNTTKTNAI